MSQEFDKEQFRQEVINNIKEQTGKLPKHANIGDLCNSLCHTILGYIADPWSATQEKMASSQQKQAYYFSAEFLMGRALGNNLINLGLYDKVIEIAKELDINFENVEDEEKDPGLGNGGLGRLAACFLDSLATLRYPSMGYGIRYKYGMFEQKIENGFQIEKPDNWLENGEHWEIQKRPQSVYVKFGGHVDNIMENSGKIGFRRNNAETVIAIPYDIPIVGYKNNHINTLRLWEAQAPEPFDLNAFNDGDYLGAVASKNAAEHISRVLYPNDNSPQGKELRLRQQYFFCSASLQDIINHFVDQYGEDKWDVFSEKIAIQLNDTHPVVSIPELMRLLMDWKNLKWDDAWSITKKVFAYTNHTVLAEAMECWDISLFQSLLPRVYQIVEEINRRFLDQLREKYPEDFYKHQRMSILENGQIRMAHLAIVGSHKVNGVAALHTEILKTDVLREWYEFYPEKFINKTNGITPRRWIIKSNPRLTKLLDSLIGNSWHCNLSDLKKLEKFADDQKVIDELIVIKQENKKELANAIKKWTGITLDPNSIFDIQAKRLHEYKRQLLNVLHIIFLYFQIKDNKAKDLVPHSFIFSAKAASGYWRAKAIIKLINNVASVINADPVANKLIRVVFIPNYSVSVAEKLFPAADISEQISTAGKEASGTGNMKFMANGAITIGTLDGANVEILEEVGEKNCVIFGCTADEIRQHNNSNDYYAYEYYKQDPALKRVLDSLVDGTFTQGEDSELFRGIYSSLLFETDGNRADVYYLLRDFASYVKAHEKINQLYKDKKLWAQIMLQNIANSGKFSSDRTIHEYAKEIWNIGSLV